MKEVTEIADFYIDESDGLYNEEERLELERAIADHLKYGTISVTLDKKDRIVAVARLNWVGETTVHIIDVVVREDHREQNILRRMLIKWVLKHPTCRFLKFEDKDMKQKEVISIADFLQRRH